MQTRFDRTQRADAEIAAADTILRRCVHCGFCTATCPTYRLSGDELDSPRGRIYLIKNLLEQNEDPGVAVRQHLDRCLACLSCSTTCPADVDYGQLLDIARKRIVRGSALWQPSSWWRRGLIALMTRPLLFFLALLLGRLAAPLSTLLPRPMRAMSETANAATLSLPKLRNRHHPAITPGRGHVLLHAGCVQQVAGERVNAAAIRLLNRVGYDVSQRRQARCCGALPRHLGESEHAREQARRTLTAWREPLERGVDAVLIAASGCIGTLSSFEELLRDDADLAGSARRVSELTRELAAFLGEQEVPWSGRPDPAEITWHAPCSLQHDIRGEAQVHRLLTEAGFRISTPADAFLCCGAAGSYSITQADIATRLGRAKSDALRRAGDGPIVSANLGCILQLRQYSDRPVLHYIELLDWASGGPRPAALG